MAPLIAVDRDLEMTSSSEGDPGLECGQMGSTLINGVTSIVMLFDMRYCSVLPSNFCTSVFGVLF